MRLVNFSLSRIVIQGFILFLIFFNQVYAQNNEKLIDEASLRNENALLNKYSIIESEWFEKTCMDISSKMKFHKITQCKLFDSHHINAYVLSNGHVYFSQAMMKLIKNKHQWASILAHENAHLELRHYKKILKKIQNPGIFFPKSKIKKMMIKHEEQADDWSKDRLIKFGYDPKQIYYFLQRVIRSNGNNKSKSHLKPSKRTEKNLEDEIINKNLINLIKALG